MAERNGQAVKRYREGNITAAFGTDLFIHGVTFVPSLLLKWYRQMGLNESEMMLLLHLLRLRTEEKELFPPAVLLGGFVSGGQAQAERDLESLLEKGVIAVTQYFGAGDQGVTEGYDFEPLFEKLSEAWARSKVHEIESTQALLENGGHAGLANPELGRLYTDFEGEFGRPLSPIEADQVKRWYRDSGPALAREALRRSVLIGKHNFKYIDSILLEWHKNNVRTIKQVQAFEQEFQQRRSERKPKKTVAESRNRDKEKALIKALYMS